MEIVEPYATLYANRLYNDNSDVVRLKPTRETLGIPILRYIESIARVSHRSEDLQTPDSWDRFIRQVVLSHGDWSVTEHGSVTVEAVVDRGITHEWVRHRLGAYTQESTRFVNYTKKIFPKVIKPEWLNANHMYLKDVNEVFDEIMTESENAYRRLLGFGITPQLARSVFPTALASKIIVTYNLRMWRHFFLMRTTKEAHPQMRKVTIPLLKEFQEVFPILYEDIVPEARQVDNLRLPR